MPHTTHFSPTAFSYAQALLELANEKNQATVIGEELRDLRQIIDTNESFALYLADPAISVAERAGMIERVFGGRISPLLKDFLGVLNQKKRIAILDEIAGAFDALLDEQAGKVEVDVTVAQTLDDAQLEDVRQRVSRALNKDAIVHQYVDESIIGGLILRVQDQLIDGSVRHQLQSIKERMLAARHR